MLRVRKFSKFSLSDKKLCGEWVDSAQFVESERREGVCVGERGGILLSYKST